MNIQKSNTQLLSGITRIQDIMTPDEVETQDWVAIVNDLLQERDNLKAEKSQLIKAHQLKQIEQSANLERANSLAQRYLSRLMKIDAEYFDEVAKKTTDVILGTTQTRGGLFKMSVHELVNVELDEAA